MLKGTTEKSNKYSELVEFLRSNLPEGAKKIVQEDKSLLNFKDDSGRIAIHWAASGGCLPFIELVLRDNPEMALATDDSGWSVLMIASSAGHFDVVKYLLSSCDCDVNHRNSNGQSSLHYAASKNLISIARMLLENGAEVNVQDNYGSAPIHRAAAKGHVDMVMLLMSQKGARVDLADREGNTALQMAVEDQNDSTAILLAKKGADINRQNREEKTPLDYCKTADLRRKLQDAASELGG
uniref:ANK_REP_REGION domain-containing protein n=1 Tax=Bursaphelenchus xylophilus TaxID=6326 RepID=A0A1I7SMG0_BURXY